MLQQDFIPPDIATSQKETSKRLTALEAFLPRISQAITSLTVTGSMAYGQNYSVTEKSDLDLQLTVTPSSVKLLQNTGIFEWNKIALSVNSYLAGQVQQFSFSINIDGIDHECHFWDEQAYLDAMEMKTELTKRIRSSNASPAIDYGFAFDGTENIYECPTEDAEGVFISVLPSFRIVNDKMFLCRPVASMLSTPIVMFGEDIVAPHINNVWTLLVARLKKEAGTLLDLDKNNILNALPGRFKMSPESKQKIMDRTRIELQKSNQT